VPFEFHKAAKQPELNVTEFEGYASTWDKDLGGDTILPGAFASTIKTRLPKNLIKVRWMHFEPFGLCTAAHEDAKGLYVKGRATNTPTNMERFALMEDKTVDRLSIGYDFPDEQSYEWQDDGSFFGARTISKVDLYEWSPVDLAMNENTSLQLAKSLMSMGLSLPKNIENYIMSELYKGATSFSDLPLASRDRAWDSNAAEKRIRSWANADDSPNAQYRKAFFWYDSENAENFTAYKLGFADIVDGKLTAIPRGIFASAAVIQGSRGGVDIPNDDVGPVKSHIEKYYAKMRREFDDDSIIAPWNNSSKSHVDIVESKVIELEHKIGAELSSKNRSKLEQAHNLIGEVLKANEAETETGTDGKSNEWENTDFSDVFSSITDFLAEYE
jgi:HK97 family phage prohead protease